MKNKKLISLGLAAALVFSLTACGEKDQKTGGTANTEVPTIDNIKLGEDYKDLKADIKILTNRTDVVDSVYKGYAEEFMKMYPNIKVTYDAVTDYEESLTLRLTSGDWGDICFIPSTADKSELGNYFTPLGDYETLNEI